MNEIENYYNKFNEEKRLDSRPGKVEFTVSMAKIHELLDQFDQPKILDIGAGTGKYSVALANEGYDVSAIELVKSNLGVLKSKKSSVKARLGNALDLSYYKDNSFDVILMFGPLYHLFTDEDKVKALNEAYRVCKPNGYVLCAYCLNDYSLLMYAFKENHIKECIENGSITSDFKCNASIQNLYDYVTCEDIDRILNKTSFKRYKQYSSDGPAYFMRQMLKDMDEESFELFLQYQLSVCEKKELLGAGAHLVDVLIKTSEI